MAIKCSHEITDCQHCVVSTVEQTNFCQDITKKKLSLRYLCNDCIQNRDENLLEEFLYLQRSKACIHIIVLKAKLLGKADKAQFHVIYKHSLKF